MSVNEITIPGIPDLGTRGDTITIYAGPCSVESVEQFDEVASCIHDLGLSWIRGGAFKPRTNPHSFQGLGEEALKIMADAGQKYGLKTLTEVMDSAHCQMVADYVDGLQVGARNFQNFSLLKKIGQVTADTHQMVLYKRGFAGTIAEWLAATDYITACGNDNVVLCERGIRTFETATRFTLDIAAVPVDQQAVAVPGMHRCVASGRPARPGAVASLRRYRRRCRLHHDRGAPATGQGPLRWPAAAHPRPVRGAGGPAARHRRRLRQDHRVNRSAVLANSGTARRCEALWHPILPFRAFLRAPKCAQPLFRAILGTRGLLACFGGYAKDTRCAA